MLKRFSIFYFLFSLVVCTLPSIGQQNYYDPNNPNSPNYNPYNNPQYNNNQKPDTLTEPADTARQVKKPFSWKNNPRIATLLSMVVPGAGQIYNKKYWKAPIVWGALGGLTYWFITSGERYEDYRLAYNYFVDYRIEPGDRESEYTKIYNKYPQDIRSYDTKFTADSISNSQRISFQRDDARRSRDFAAVFFILAYILNMADAAVDAHFANFDVSDKLSMKIEPTFQISSIGQPQLGLYVGLKFNDPRRKQKTGQF